VSLQFRHGLHLAQERRSDHSPTVLVDDLGPYDLVGVACQYGRKRTSHLEDMTRPPNAMEELIILITVPLNKYCMRRQKHGGSRRLLTGVPASEIEHSLIV